MATSKRIKLSEFAKQQGISYITAHRHWKADAINGVQLPSGTILVSGWKEGVNPASEAMNAVVYARVANPTQKQQLDQQVKNLTALAEEKGYNIIEVVEEVATGFSDHRTKLLNVLYRPDWDVLVVDSKDTFMKFGFPYVEALLRKNGQEVVVLNESISNDPTTVNVTLTGEQNLITMIQRTRAVLKNLIGMGSVKGNIETIIQSLLD